jgi:hypothetical protein
LEVYITIYKRNPIRKEVNKCVSLKARKSVSQNKLPALIRLKRNQRKREQNKKSDCLGFKKAAG